MNSKPLFQADVWVPIGRPDWHTYGSAHGLTCSLFLAAFVVYWFTRFVSKLLSFAQRSLRLRENHPSNENGLGSNLPTSPDHRFGTGRGRLTLSADPRERWSRPSRARWRGCPTWPSASTPSASQAGRARNSPQPHAFPSTQGDPHCKSRDLSPQITAAELC